MRAKRWPEAFVLFIFVIGFLLSSVPLSGQAGRKITKLADGVYEIEHQGRDDPNASGNTTVIIGDRQVFVVDSGFLPSDAQKDIAQIRQWTDKPVSFVLNTHFHNDHNFGNRVYMNSFPAVTIIAEVETKKEMDRFGPGSVMRQERGVTVLQKMLESGKGPDGKPLTEEDRAEVKKVLAQRIAVVEEMKQYRFQSATLTFDHDFSVDLGNREVQVKFLGRGNTAGDAVVYLPKEKIVVAGDLVVFPMPYVYDGYPSEWIQTLENLARMEAESIVPGHGPVLHDKQHIFLVRDLFKSAVDQMNAKLGQTSPAMFQSLDNVKGAIDLSPFRERFAGSDKDLGAEFDDMAAHLVKVVFTEASLR